MPTPIVEFVHGDEAVEVDLTPASRDSRRSTRARKLDAVRTRGGRLCIDTTTVRYVLSIEADYRGRALLEAA